MFIQTTLKTLNYYSGTVDGVPGPATSKAILQYQRDKGLPLSGTWTTEFLQHLKKK